MCYNWSPGISEVYEVPLGYDFEIYTYGPYSSEVMEEIDWARHKDIISMDEIYYSSGYVGYNFKPSTNVEKIIKKEKDFISCNENKIEMLIKTFGDKTAKELELLTTIIFLYQTYEANNWICDAEEISKNVHEIKPHFDISAIREKYSYLEELDILNKRSIKI